MNFPTLLDIAKQVLFEEGEQTTHKQQLALYHCVQAVKRLTFDVLGQCKSTALPVTAARTLRLPADAVGLSALLDARNRPLLEDLNPATTPGPYPPRQSDALGSVTPGREGRGYGALTPLTNTAGHYRFEPMTGLVQLSPDCPLQPGDLVTAVYTTTGIVATGETLVHPYSEQFVLSYAKARMDQPKRTVGLGEKQMQEAEWKNELRLAEKRHKKSTKAEWLAVLAGRQRRTI